MHARVAAALLLLSATPLSAQQPSAPDCEKHLDETVELIRDWWAFYIFKPGAFDLDAASASLRPAAARADTPDACADVLDRFVATLGDGHANLMYFPGRTPQSSPAGIRLLRFKDRLVRPGQARPDQRIYVVSVDTSRAQLREIPVGSLVVAIDGRPVNQVLDSIQLRMSGSTAWNREHWTDRAALRGLAGTQVTLSLRTPDGASRAVALDRPAVISDEKERERLQELHDDTVTLVEWRRLENDLGYIRLTTFYDTRAVEDFDAALEALKDTRGLVLDMRSNGGGRSDVLQQIVGRFFNKRQTRIARLLIRTPGATTVSRSPEAMVANRRKWTYEAPLAVLIDAGCFSACDLFANAIDENGRGLLIGATPTGGGSASPINWAVIPSFDGVVVRASFMVALRQDGDHIESKGVRPHITVVPTLDDYIAGRDPLLERAVQAILTGQAKPLAQDR